MTSVQQLTQRTEQKLSESSQQMEALSLDLDGMHAEVGPVNLTHMDNSQS